MDPIAEMHVACEGLASGTVGGMIANIIKKARGNTKAENGPKLNPAITKLYFATFGLGLSKEDIVDKVARNMEYPALSDLYISPADALAITLMRFGNDKLKGDDPSTIVWSKRTIEKMNTSKVYIYTIEVEGACQMCTVWGVPVYTTKPEAVKSCTATTVYNGIEKAIQGTNCRYKFSIGNDTDEMADRKKALATTKKLARGLLQKLTETHGFMGMLTGEYAEDSDDEFVDLISDSATICDVNIYEGVDESVDRDMDMEKKRWNAVERFENELEVAILRAGLNDYEIAGDFDKWEGVIYLQVKKH